MIRLKCAEEERALIIGHWGAMAYTPENTIGTN
jgi:glycerophosphoryl diester phosphodiesterase